MCRQACRDSCTLAPKIKQPHATSSKVWIRVPLGASAVTGLHHFLLLVAWWNRSIDDSFRWSGLARIKFAKGDWREKPDRQGSDDLCTFAFLSSSDPWPPTLCCISGYCLWEVYMPNSKSLSRTPIRKATVEDWWIDNATRKNLMDRNYGQVICLLPLLSILKSGGLKSLRP